MTGPPGPADFKRQRVGSFDHAPLPAPRPPPPSQSSPASSHHSLLHQHQHPPPPPPSRHPPVQHQPHHLHHHHQHHHPLPYPQHSSPSHPHAHYLPPSLPPPPPPPASSASGPSHPPPSLPPPPAALTLSPPHAQPPPLHQHQQQQQQQSQQQQQQQHPPVHPPAAPPPAHPPQSGSPNPPDYRQRPYSSHASLPMPSVHHQEHSSDPSQYRQRPPPPGPPPISAGYHHHQQHFSNESVSARTPTTPSQPHSAVDPNARHAPMYHDPYRPPPEPAQHSPYPASGQSTPHPLAMHPNHDPQRAYAYHSHPAQPDPAAYDYNYGGSMVGNSSDSQSKRKAVRASQACESCRQKKCKCDEERPVCGNCQQNGTECNYRNLPPPKQERNMMQVIDSITALGSQIAEMRNYFSAAFARRDEVDSIHRELREFRDEVKGAQHVAKRSSDYSQSPASRSHFASPRPPIERPHHGSLPGSGRLENARSLDLHHSHDTQLDSPDGHQRSESGPSVTSKPSSQQPSHRTLPADSTRRVLDDESLRKFDPLAGQLSIPIEHTTGAHKLLIAWDAIHPFYEGIIGQEYVKNYVWHEETQRGQLRLYGQGEGHDGLASGELFPPAMRSPANSEADSSSASSTTGDGFWGFGFDGPLEPPFDTAGGLSPDGSLCLDRATVHRLFNSFMDNIWIMHPFFNKQHITSMFERFARRYCWDNGTSTSPMTSMAEIKSEGPGQFRATKRKRSHGSTDDFEPPPSKPFPSAESRRMPLERSVNNAVMLLIFALGRMCEHKDPLPAPVTPGEGPPNHATEPFSPPPDPTSKSPLPVHSPWSAPTHGINGASRAPSHESPHPFSLRFNRKIRNIDRIPGLAYYSYATGILGEQQGAPDLAHVHARILAGVFMAQMARVIDSWSWIQSACIACKLLFRDEVQLENEFPPERADAIRFAFWTCLQLESDILAELSELPHSGISRLEELMPLPRWSTLHYPPGSDEQKIMTYYNAQIHLRKILNRAHSALYNSGKESLKNPGWTIFTAEDLALQLSEWKNSLPPGLSWSDEDEPAPGINDARLRAKYYGAQYIIHRPFLHHLLQDEFARPVPEMKKLITLKTHEKEGIIGMARKCIEAAVKSTIAFDGLQGRPIITNIFGTAHAQFGNILVLAACYMSHKYRWFTSRHNIEYLIERTARFVGNLAPLAPTMKTDLRILHNTTDLLRRNRQSDDRSTHGSHSSAASASFSSASNA